MARTVSTYTLWFMVDFDLLAPSSPHMSSTPLAVADEGLGEGTGGAPSDADASPPVSPSAGDAASGGGGKGDRRPFMGALRRKAAKKLRQLAETTATHISRSV